jgi:hypothetical protein
MKCVSFLDTEAQLRVGVVCDQPVYACPAGQTLLGLLGDASALREAGESALADPRRRPRRISPAISCWGTSPPAICRRRR